VLEHHRACRGGKSALAHALQQRHAHLPLEEADLHADRGLREVQLAGGTRESAVAADGLESAQVRQLQVGTVHEDKKYLIV
jgi:hypothetical protein